MSDMLLYGRGVDGYLRHISEVESGLSCNCTCPSCGGMLVAKKGDIKIHHFAHENNNMCEYGVETSLHIIAKNLFLKHNKMFLPRIDQVKGKLINKHIFGDWHKVNSVSLENKLSDVVPDVIVDTDIGRIFVEIYVTHRCDLRKKLKLNKLGIPTIEINLSKDSHYNEQELWSLFKSRSYWVYENFEVDKDERIRQFEEKRILNTVLPSVEMCTRYGRSVTSIHCKHCIYCGGMSKEYVYCGCKSCISDLVSLGLSEERRIGYDMLRVKRINKCWYCCSKDTIQVTVDGKAICKYCGKKTWLETYGRN